MGSHSIWIEENIVKNYQTDYAKRWKPASFFQAMQEASTHHAAQMGFPLETLMARKTVWILSRVKILFHAFPQVDEKVIFRTWPKGIAQRLFFMRDFEIEGESGQHFATATTAWVLVNPEVRRLLPPSAMTGDLPDNDGLAAMTEIPDKLNPRVEMPEKLVVTPGYSDIDMMGHVNNARYIDWVCNCFSMQEWRQNSLRWLQINYINEAVAEEALSIRAETQEGDECVSSIVGIHQSSGKIAFEAALGWQKN